VEKPQGSFYKRTNRKAGYSSHCKTCANELTRLSRVKRRLVDPDFAQKELLSGKTWIQNNKEKHRELTKAWFKRHSKSPEFLAGARVSTAKYKAKKLQASPAWLTEKHLQEIRNIYLVCSKVSKTTKKLHDVDHIVPLQGKNVCGLHVPWNLRIIPAGMNRSKKNAFDTWATHDPKPKQLQQTPIEPTDRGRSKRSSEYPVGENEHPDGRNYEK
jgi:hypothetical protein